MNKRILCLVMLCLLLVNTAFASAKDEFLGNLSKTWDSFLGMVDEAGSEASNAISGWLNGAGDSFDLWVDDMSEKAAEWLRAHDIAEDVSAESIRSFIAENRDRLIAWYTSASGEVRQAIQMLLDPEGAPQQEIRQALKTITDSLQEAGIDVKGLLEK